MKLRHRIICWNLDYTDCGVYWVRLFWVFIFKIKKSRCKQNFSERYGYEKPVFAWNGNRLFIEVDTFKTEEE